MFVLEMGSSVSLMTLFSSVLPSSADGVVTSPEVTALVELGPSAWNPDSSALLLEVAELLTDSVAWFELLFCA